MSSTDINSLYDVIFALEAEYECIVHEQRKKISLTRYLKLQDRAVTLLNCIELLQERIRAEECAR